MRYRFILCIGLLCVLAAPSAIFGQSGEGSFASRSDVQLSTIRNLIEAKDYSSAEKLAAELADKQPELVDAWMLLGYARTLDGRYGESNDAYDARSTTAPIAPKSSSRRPTTAAGWATPPPRATATARSSRRILRTSRSARSSPRSRIPSATSTGRSFS